jgi:hypothetical protein
MFGTLLAGLAGAAAVYFLDPENGGRRRTMLVERVRGMLPTGSTDGQPAGGRWRDNTSDQLQGGRDATAEGDEVTEQSQESFPASDPPSWQPARVGASKPEE